MLTDYRGGNLRRTSVSLSFPPLYFFFIRSPCAHLYHNFAQRSEFVFTRPALNGRHWPCSHNIQKTYLYINIIYTYNNNNNSRSFACVLSTLVGSGYLPTAPNSNLILLAHKTVVSANVGGATAATARNRLRVISCACRTSNQSIATRTLGRTDGRRRARKCRSLYWPTANGSPPSSTIINPSARTPISPTCWPTWTWTWTSCPTTLSSTVVSGWARPRSPGPDCWPNSKTWYTVSGRAGIFAHRPIN